ncbi:peptidylprolyl isomerase [Paenibacillus allorhizosphaerae]|uniref:Foldase protein PrsA n=1 Tax=Paenibacillus allorhizosphaerae TaxID=2849866 RepID=A0ABN7TNK6_9BACL|nr:peptidylprolyl isomerase [Paenibacillus allorhizosphaerae]CAG7648699.1 Foldase protein PrsA [Paenibacillus allorhizosphaerae]
MNDKVKGLVLGLSLGVMMTGSIAFASGTQIEVYFQNLKYMFDGVEKKPTEEQGAGFIYNGTTYVPLRFVSEALGKEVGYDADTETIWVGKKPNAIVAAYQGGQVTQEELDTYIKLNRFVQSSVVGNTQDQRFMDMALRHLIGYRILDSRLTDEMKDAVTKETDKQLEQIKQYLLLTRGSDDLSSLLAKEGFTVEDLRGFVRLYVGGNQVLTSGITDLEIRNVYVDQATHLELLSASVRHILIGFSDPNGNQRSKEDTLKLAQDLKARLDKGEDFAQLAKQFSEDPGSKDNGGLYEDAMVRDWVEPFKNAVKQLKLNEISKPVETEFGYHVIRVESLRTLHIEEAKDEIVQGLVNEHYNKFMNDELPGLIEKIELSKK